MFFSPFAVAARNPVKERVTATVKRNMCAHICAHRYGETLVEGAGRRLLGGISFPLSFPTFLYSVIVLFFCFGVLLLLFLLSICTRTTFFFFLHLSHLIQYFRVLS